MSQDLSAACDPAGNGDHGVGLGGRPADADRWLANAGSLVGGRLLVAVLGWTGTIIIARTLDQETFGRFTFVFGILGMMTIATDLGLGRVAISGVMPGASDPRAFAGSYVVLRFGLGVVGYGLAVGFTAAAGYSADIVRATAIAGAVVVLATASHAYEVVLQAHLRMQMIAVSAVVGRLAQLGLIVAVVVAGGGFLWLLVPAILAEVVIAAIKIPSALRLQPMRYSIRPRLWRTLLAEAIPLSIGTALTTLYFRVDSIMLSKLDDFSAVATYGVAFKFIDLLHFLALSISAPLLTVLVRSWPADPDSFHQAVDRAVALLALLAGILLVHFGLFAEETIRLLYGSTYTDGGFALRLLVVGEIIAFCSAIGLTILTATGKHRPFPYIALTGLLANVALNLWAIPRWSFEGAAAVTVATEVIVVLAMWRLVRRVPGFGPIGFGPIAPVLPAIVLALMFGLLLAPVTPWAFAATSTGVAFIAGAAASGLLRRAGVFELLRRVR